MKKEWKFALFHTIIMCIFVFGGIGMLLVIVNYLHIPLELIGIIAYSVLLTLGLMYLDKKLDNWMIKRM